MLLFLAALYIVFKQQEEDEGTPFFGAVITPEVVFQIVFLWPFILADAYNETREK